MAMMISKFHKLIQSRMVWGIILVLIVIAFVGLYIQWPSQTKKAEEAGSVGMLNGKHIHWQEFRNAYMNTYLSLSMMLGRALNVTEEIDEELRTAAWRRLASLRKAEELGLSATDSEVVSAIQHHPGFSSQGRFSQVMYNHFVDNVLRNMGVSELQFEQHVREEIALQKLRNMVSQSILISPYELQRTFSTLSDTFDVQYTVVDTNAIPEDINVTDEDVHAFFEEDPEKFLIPEKVDIRYVAFPISNYLDGIEINEEDALVYYDEHLEEFTEEIETTNRVETVDVEDQNVEDELTEVEWEQESKTLPFEDVQSNIEEKLAWQRARNRAIDIATDFVVALTPDRSGNAPSFAELAAEQNLAVHDLHPFALNEDLAELDTGYRFNESAFSLRPNRDERFSDAIEGEDTIYVQYLDDRLDARIPAFEEVQEDVRIMAEADALSQAIVDKAQAVQKAAQETGDKGNSFSNAVVQEGLELHVITNLSAAATIEEEEEEDTDSLKSEVLRSVLVQNEGETTEMLPLEDGVLLAYVAKRTPGDPALFSAYRPQIVQSLQRERARTMFNAWQDHLLEAGGFNEKRRDDMDYAEEEETADIATNQTHNKDDEASEAQ
jgi:hypothetical protein